MKHIGLMLTIALIGCTMAGCYEDGGKYRAAEALGEYCDNTKTPYCIGNYLVTCRNNALDYIDCELLGKEYSCLEFTAIHHAADCAPKCEQKYAVEYVDECAAANPGVTVNVCYESDSGDLGLITEGTFKTYCAGNAYYTCHNNQIRQLACMGCKHSTNDTVSCQN